MNDKNKMGEVMSADNANGKIYSNLEEFLSDNNVIMVCAEDVIDSLVDDEDDDEDEIVDAGSPFSTYLLDQPWTSNIFNVLESYDDECNYDPSKFALFDPAHFSVAETAMDRFYRSDADVIVIYTMRHSKAAAKVCRKAANIINGWLSWRSPYVNLHGNPYGKNFMMDKPIPYLNGSAYIIITTAPTIKKFIPSLVNIYKLADASGIIIDWSHTHSILSSLSRAISHDRGTTDGQWYYDKSKVYDLRDSPITSTLDVIHDRLVAPTTSPRSTNQFIDDIFDFTGYRIPSGYYDVKLKNKFPKLKDCLRCDYDSFVDRPGYGFVCGTGKQYLELVKALITYLEGYANIKITEYCDISGLKTKDTPDGARAEEPPVKLSDSVKIPGKRKPKKNKSK